MTPHVRDVSEENWRGSTDIRRPASSRRSADRPLTPEEGEPASSGSASPRKTKTRRCPPGIRTSFPGRVAGAAAVASAGVARYAYVVARKTTKASEPPAASKETTKPDAAEQPAPTPTPYAIREEPFSASPPPIDDDGSGVHDLLCRLPLPRAPSSRAGTAGGGGDRGPRALSLFRRTAPLWRGSAAVPKTRLRVIVHDSRRLHPRVDDGGTDELEAALFEGDGDALGEGRFCEGHRALDRRAARHRPDEGGEVLARGLHREIGAGAADGRFDLGAGADDVGVLEEAGDIGLIELRDEFGLEAFEGFAECFALAEDDEPRETGLKPIKHEFFPEAAAVVFGDAPFLIVVGLEERVGFGPFAALGHDRPR